MTADVVIAGGGPNGLMLACELALAGVRPIVLERLPERSQAPKANGIIGQVVRLLDQRGLYQRFLGVTEPPRPIPMFLFGALPLDLAGVEGNTMYGMGIKQARLEELFEERARELGVEIRRGRELTAFTQDEEGVTLELDGGDRLRTRYLVGCDGAHSTVRKQAGIGFPGTNSASITSRAAHVVLPTATIRMDRAELDLPGVGTVSLYAWHRTERGAYGLLPLSPEVLTISCVEWDGDDPGEDVEMTLGELRESLARVLGADIPLAAPPGPGPHLLRRLTGRNTRVADRFRAGRVLLAGDAAHVHSAVGAPGLNLGLQDAANLGWKLAATVRGTAPPGLLDSYERERHLAADRVTTHSKAQLALMSPGPEVTALREVFGELLKDESARSRISALMSGADVAYPTAAPAHPLTGHFVPDLELEPVSLATLMRTGRPLLLDLDGGLQEPLRADTWGDRIDVVTAKCLAPPADALLIRPDGYVAWAGTPDESLDEAVRTWFG
ncbi:FAD-dependent monooxygenase [Nonomuraea guangzhouensis]|uniref:FAD-dependent monooxygenase n=1 Tax=Nonomuraea guangzhouensis TaxID=1291555 RepID=A0ABW4GR11_9ACTN|nr:FAD-dependent monooxygenase [Nonomuraea guangzhouensis]